MATRYQGIIRNEDNFSLQLQSEDGAFHFLSKADLKTIERGQDIHYALGLLIPIERSPAQRYCQLLAESCPTSSALSPAIRAHSEDDE